MKLLLPVLERLAQAAERIARALESQDRPPSPSQRPAAPECRDGPEIGLHQLTLPEEVGTAEAAKILGVSKDTVLAYREGGLLPSRNLAPGGARPIYKFPLEAVIRLRTGYETEQPAAEAPRERPRRKRKGTRTYKHLTIDDGA
jgi:hypothetical protein